ncbi:hypothetical protein KJ966_19310 [bacterium]|nr:hypothetical protein [bacterium]
MDDPDTTETILVDRSCQKAGKQSLQNGSVIDHGEAFGGVLRQMEQSTSCTARSRAVVMRSLRL